MTAEEKRIANVLKRAKRTVINIDKELDNLDKASDKVSMESAEYHLIGTAKHDLYEAREHLVIVVNRIEHRQKGE